MLPTPSPRPNSPFHPYASYTEEEIIKVQLIKRVYRSTAEIFVGFDLDASCAAYDDGKLYVCDRWLLAVKYGINVVCPFRQSSTYNYRLYKYVTKGFAPLVPDGVHFKNSKLVVDSWTGEHKDHVLSELVAYQAGFHIKRVKEVSDYHTDTLHWIESQGHELDAGARERAAKYNLRPIRTLYLSYRFGDGNGSDESDESNESTEAEYIKYSNFMTYEQFFDNKKRRREEEKQKMLEFRALLERQGRDYTYDNSFGHHSYPPATPGTLMMVLSATGDLHNWRTTSPGTQISASFHPTNYDYLAS